MDEVESSISPAPALTTTTQQDTALETQRNVGPPIHLLAEKAVARAASAEKPLDEDARCNASMGGPWDFYSSAQWTADGTSILVSSSEQTISTFVLPADILEATEKRALEPQSVLKFPEPTQTVVGAPYFSLAEPASQTFLAGCRDHPIQLYHAFPNDRSVPLCSYKLIRQETEQYITPSSMLWQYPGTHFICGSANRIDQFDVTRHGSDGPVLTIATIPSKRHIAKGSGVGMKGTVSALAASPPDTNGGSIIAAGTWTRWIGLYDLYRSDKIVANWAVSNTVDSEEAADIGGQGIVQVLWSPCGRYLVINERQSDGLLVYDIRGSGKLLSVLKGRRALTQQKLNCDVFQSDVHGSQSFEVWAGSQDGTVQVWEDVGMTEGASAATWDWKAHESPVGSTIVHSSGSVAATCSGGWGPPSSQDIETEFGASGKPRGSQKVFRESSVKIWSVGGSQGGSGEEGDE